MGKKNGKNEQANREQFLCYVNAIYFFFVSGYFMNAGSVYFSFSEYNAILSYLY